ncbi:GTP-binding protein EngA [invertebrate metagenome]|uniref:GTPase Der n=1 Tax=invertebrate metagenome TaxID=1711999 RepID=A0A484H5P3_9ZZZZ
MSFVVAIVGRPNVGKSTLFNRLVGRRLALVYNHPGVTRDRREGHATFGGLAFTAIDTAGLAEAAPDTLEGRLYAQTRQAIAEADVALMLIDARLGITPADQHFARILRQSPTPVVLVANKCEHSVSKLGLWEAHVLGLGEPIALSAEHGEGLANLIEALLPFYNRTANVLSHCVEGTPRVERVESTPTIAIIGRPNVGKSTLINRLLSRERMVTGPEAGITRDAITVDWDWCGRKLRLVDTAGLKRRSKGTSILDGISRNSTLRAINFAHIIVLLLDANAILERQDLTLARMIISEGRALVLAVNKWDIVQDSAAAEARLQARLIHALPQAWGLHTLTLSARTGAGVEQLLQAAFDVYVLWNRRIPTAALNRWLSSVLRHHPPPLGRHARRLQLRYLTQTNTRPPTFVLFSSRPEDLPDSYLRYLINDLRRTFDLPGVPVRLYPRRSDNPYARYG